MFKRLKKLGKHIEDVVTQISRILNVVGMICVAILMLLISGDVLARQLFNRSIPGTLSISEFTLVCAVFCSLAYCAVVKGHVKVGILASRFKEKGQDILNLVSGFIGVALFSLLSWAATVAAMDSWNRAEASLDQLAIPVWPFRAVLVFGITILCLVLLVDFYHLVAGVVKKWTQAL